MQPEIQNLAGDDPNINPPKNRLPNNASPHADRDNNANYFNSDKDFSKFSPFSPITVNQMHTRSDIDSGPTAQHHTLGYGRNQASPGSHVHDGTTSKPIGAGLGLTVSGSKAGNAALASLILQLQKIMDLKDVTT